MIKNKIQQFLFDEIDEAVWLRFIKKLAYCKLDLNQSDDYQKLTDYVNPSERVVISYLAIPPSLYSQTCRSLARLNLTQKPSRVVLENLLAMICLLL